jgi:transcriptional regulator with GAF, ATPase, and Fis domain
MVAKDIISIDTYKVVARAIAESDNLRNMTSQLTQLLVGTLGIKGCTIFALNPEEEELEVLASFGLSTDYLNKGPLLLSKSIDRQLREPTVVGDVGTSDRLQYPEDAQKEGIGAMVSLPIDLYGKFIGALRLYHYEKWEVSDRDLDSLTVLAETIGMAMMYTRLLNAVQSVKDTVDDIHPIWLDRK